MDRFWSLVKVRRVEGEIVDVGERGIVFGHLVAVAYLLVALLSYRDHPIGRSCQLKVH